MCKKVLLNALFVFSYSLTIISSDYGYNISSSIISPNSIFFQSGNINTVFRTDGILNYDKVTFTGFEAGFVWPAASSQRLTSVFTSGIWIGTKAILPGNQKELRFASAFFDSHFSQGNIPVIGQVPPVSVCNDSAFNGYLVSVTDQSLVNGGVRTKIAGGRTYTFNYSSWSAWPVSLGAPYVEVNGIPGYQPGWNSDRPGTGNGDARPSELIYMVYMDYTNCTNDIHENQVGQPGGTLPLGVEIQHVVYAFDIDGFRDSYFVRYKFINKSANDWDSTYITLLNDPDVGDAFDDAIGCDSSKNIAFGYNTDNNDPMYGSAPPAVGYRMLQGPVEYTGLNSDTAKLPCNSLIGYKMKMVTGHTRFVNGANQCYQEPFGAPQAYNYMRGKDACGYNIINPVTGLTTTYMYSGNACNKTGWYDSSSGDKRNAIHSGPIFMNSGDTQVVVYSYTIAKGTNNNESVCRITEISDYLNYYYYNCFNLIGIEPVNNIIPEKFALNQNYPNPFNPETNISFSIPQKSFAELKVFDVLGRELETLLREEVNAGTYRINFNAVKYPSGIYFYRLAAGSFTETKKMILVK